MTGAHFEKYFTCALKKTETQETLTECEHEHEREHERGLRVNVTSG